MATDISVFDSFLGGYKTYIAAGIGIVFDSLTAFHVWTPDPQQMVAINGLIFGAAALFLRMGIKKAQTQAAAATAAAAATSPAADQAAKTVIANSVK